jgi:hypothetical protein
VIVVVVVMAVEVEGVGHTLMAGGGDAGRGVVAGSSGLRHQNTLQFFIVYLLFLQNLWLWLNWIPKEA